MMLTKQQARVVAALAERSVDGQVAIKVDPEQKGPMSHHIALRPSDREIENAVQKQLAEVGLHDGWKHYQVEPSGRATAITKL